MSSHLSSALVFHLSPTLGVGRISLHVLHLSLTLVFLNARPVSSHLSPTLSPTRKLTLVFDLFSHLFPTGGKNDQVNQLVVACFWANMCGLSGS